LYILAQKTGFFKKTELPKLTTHFTHPAMRWQGHIFMSTENHTEVED